MKTVPGIDMSRTQLRDSSCKPKEYNKEHAFFKFHVTTCGTSVRVSLWPEQIHLLHVSVSSAFSLLMPCPRTRDNSVFNELPICTVWRWSHCLWKWNLLWERDSSRTKPADNHKRSRLQVGAATAQWQHTLVVEREHINYCFSHYSLTVLCYYRTKETVMLGAFISKPSASHPSGSGTIVPRSNSAGRQLSFFF